MFGGIDINYRSVHSGSNRFSGLASDGVYSSRLGVRGTEELGAGLKANFHLEGALSPDTGLGASAGGFNFQRRSVVGLEGAFGSVVAGRDYTPLFGVSGVVDPFGTNGVGSSYNLLNNVIVAAPTTSTATASTFRTGLAAAATGANAAAATFTTTTWADPSAIRMNNAIGYTSPSFSGFIVAAMYSFGNENANLARDAGTGASVRLTYAQGPLVISLANQMVKGGITGTAAPTVIIPNDDQKWTTNFLGASYDFGILKLSAGYKTDKLSGDAELGGRLKGGIVGVTAPVGPVVLRASYIERRLGDDKIGTQGAIGVSYDLSKRTAVYANYAELDNEANYGMSVNGTSGSGAAMSEPGGRSRGLEMGVRHIF